MKIYNTLKRAKEDFTPLSNNHIRIYVCGPTVYDEPHIGHARGAFSFDVVVRYLRFKGYRVTYVRNITDIDDKIIKKAQETGLTVKEVSQKYLTRYNEDMAALGIGHADKEPKATEHIREMVVLIEGLIEKGFAYCLGGDVYFEVRRFKDYGCLSHQNIEEMEKGVRVDVKENKKDALDFALWKASKEGEPSWDSPWGGGRPGWHIECSAMSSRYLGDEFDIHGGGLDLIFPHHENEIAQSRCFSGKRFAGVWMHNGLLTINAEKMAKSLGNFISIKYFLQKYEADVLKIFFLSGHYRSPLDYTDEKMQECKTALEKFHILFDRIERLSTPTGHESRVTSHELDMFRNKFQAAMDDDFNTAEALAVLFELANYANKLIDHGAPAGEILAAKKELVGLGNILGLFQVGRKEIDAGLKTEIESLIKKREDARKKKDFKLADTIRSELLQKGIILEDEKTGTIWRIK